MNVIKVDIRDTPDMDPDDTPEARAARLQAQSERFKQDDYKRMDAVAQAAEDRPPKLREELLELQGIVATTIEGFDLKKRRTSEAQAALDAAEIQLKKLRGDYFGDEVEPVPAPGVVEAVPASGPAAAAVLTHTIKRRADPLAAAIKQAEGRSADAGDWSSVWASLVVIAQSNSHPPPLIGYVEGEGVKYQTDSAINPVKCLTREAFRKRQTRS